MLGANIIRRSGMILSEAVIFRGAAAIGLKSNRKSAQFSQNTCTDHPRKRVAVPRRPSNGSESTSLHETLYQSPEAIDELLRVLRLHLGLKAESTNIVA